MNYRTVTVRDDQSDSAYVLREAIGLDDMAVNYVNTRLFAGETNLSRGHILGTYYYSRIVVQLVEQTVGDGGLRLPGPDDVDQQDAYDALLLNPRYATLWRRLSNAINTLILVDPDPDLSPPSDGNAKNVNSPTSD